MSRPTLGLCRRCGRDRVHIRCSDSRAERFRWHGSRSRLDRRVRMAGLRSHCNAATDQKSRNGLHKYLEREAGAAELPVPAGTQLFQRGSIDEGSGGNKRCNSRRRGFHGGRCGQGLQRHIPHHGRGTGSTHIRRHERRTAQFKRAESTGYALTMGLFFGQRQRGGAHFSGIAGAHDTKYVFPASWRGSL